MSRCRSSSRSGKGKQPEAPRLRLETIPEEHGATSENSEEGSFDAYDVLSPLYQQALATRARIEPKVSLFPELAAQSEEYLDQEILYVSDAFFGGVEEEDPAEAKQKIEEGIARMEGFASDLTSRIRASRTRPRRAASDPGPHRPARSFVFDSSGQAGESSAIGTPRQQEQEYLRNVPVLRAEPGDNPAGHEIMRPGEPATFTPSPLVRRATIGGEVVLPNPLTSSGFRRPLTFKSVVSALRISPGETRLQKVKDLWRRARDRLKKDSST